MREATILVLDDDKDTRHILTRTLKKMGYEVLSVENGQEAIRAVASQKFHLALLDIKMPDMEARQAIAEMRNYNPQMPVVLMTDSTGWPDLRALLMTMSIQGWIYKPLLLAEVRSMVERVLGGSSQEEP